MHFAVLKIKEQNNKDKACIAIYSLFSKIKSKLNLHTTAAKIVTISHEVK